MGRRNGGGGSLLLVREMSWRLGLERVLLLLLMLQLLLGLRLLEDRRRRVLTWRDDECQGYRGRLTV